MCGIAGIVSLTPDLAGRELIRTVTRRLAHRGPDDEGFQSLLDDRVHLGHRRLAIVDLSEAGHQPMVDGRQRCWIVYNGEIYNHPELRAELQALGHTFRSGSDTEVILAAYMQWGPECLRRFNGMWAFAIVDTERRELFLARDRFGVKPLHYYTDGTRLIFASEIKAIVSHPAVSTSPDLDWCRSYLELGSREYTRETAFRNVFRFPHSHYAIVPLDRPYDVDSCAVRYWHLRPGGDDERFDARRAAELAQRYYALLRSAVELRLRSDVKVGSALSGGLDSSTIVHSINELLAERGAPPGSQETFSVVYRDYASETCDESEFIDAAVRELGVKSHRIQPKTDDIPRECLLNVYAMDNPPESSCMSAWHTFKLVASTDVVVTIDGQGADEQLGGYLHYLLSFTASSPRYPWRSALRAARMPGAWRYVLVGTLLRVVRAVFGESAARHIVDRHRPGLRGALLSPNEWLVQSTLTGLVTLLHFADRTSMAYSVESRMPFMDFRLAEFLAAVPPAYKFHDGWTKYLARLGVDDRLPNAITWRKDKKGWPIPEDHWFRGAHKEWFCTTIEQSAFLQSLGVGQDVRARLERGDPIGPLVRLLNLALWHSIYFGPDRPFLRLQLPGRGEQTATKPQCVPATEPGAVRYAGDR